MSQNKVAKNEKALIEYSDFIKDSLLNSRYSKMPLIIKIDREANLYWIASNLKR
tara:strand:+ start:331 stop:492 length:162 start_codon:yes stop_codon:yes gene_type:complete